MAEFQGFQGFAQAMEASGGYNKRCLWPKFEACRVRHPARMIHAPAVSLG